jgi:hypothetical protein
MAKKKSDDRPQYKGPLSGDAPAGPLAGSVHGYSHRLPRSLAAINAIQPPLTEEEMNLYRHHLMNMRPGRWIQQPDGSTSTVIQRSEEGADYGGIPGQAYNFPSVWNAQELRGDPLWEAVQPMSQWPHYPNYDVAEQRYMDQMHPAMELDMLPSKMVYPSPRKKPR